MDSIQGLGSYAAIYAVNQNTAVNLANDLLAAELTPLSQGLFGGTSSIVDTSGAGQLLSAASVFQDSLTGLQANIAANGIGPANAASVANTLVEAFNTLQAGIAGSAGLGNPFGGGTLDGTNLAQALDSQALASYPNGNSSLTSLSQIGIGFQPAQGFGTGALSLNQDTLQSAFTSDPAGAASLLSQAVDSFASLANTFVAQAGSQYAALSSLMQFTAFDSLFNPGQTSSLLGGYFGLFGWQNQPQNNLSGADTRNVLLALTNYLAVSQLFS